MLKNQLPAPQHLANILDSLAQTLIPLAGIGVFGTILWIYIQDTSFWLDEAAVATNLRAFSVSGVFGPLSNGQYFPRFVLLFIGWLREIFGYKTAVLRALPLFAAAIATLLWTWLLMRRTPRDLASRFVIASLLLGSSFWMYYGPQLKQYSTDVLFALVPFALSDAYFDERFKHGRKRFSVVLLAIPALLSYTYPIALMGRFFGWALGTLRTRPWKFDFPAFALLGLSSAVIMRLLWAVDLKFNLATDLTSYWRSCILQARLQDGGATSGLRLLLNTFWGWQAHLPRPLTAGIAVLQALGFYSVVRGFFRTADWGTRSLGSIITLFLLVVASTFYTYPICSGRLTLFTQIHTQLLAAEGLVWVFSTRGKLSTLLYSAQFVVLVLGALSFSKSFKEMVRIATTEPASNLKAMIADVKPDLSKTLFVTSCSALELDAMPEAFPVKTIIRGEKNQIPKGTPVYILWGHSTEACDQDLARMKREAVSWKAVSAGSGRGLALAIFK